MSAWEERTIEQRNLLNPAFCAIVVWQLAYGYRVESLALESRPAGLPLELAFIGASLVLRGQTRDQLPNSIATSLATWMLEHPLERSAVAKGVVVLRDIVRESVLFGAQHSILRMNGPNIFASDTDARKIKIYSRQSSEEVKDCMRQAYFAGRWLRRAGETTTVMALLGVLA